MSSVVYQLVEKDSGEPFYIGVTNNPKRRIQEHHSDMRNNSQYYVHKKMRKIYRNGGRVEISVIIEGLSNAEAYQEEMRLISEYKNMGKSLCNLTDGGEGGIGHKPIFHEEWRKKLSDAAKSRVKRDGVPFKGKKHTELTRKKISAKQKPKDGDKNPFFGKSHSNDLKKKFSDERTGFGLKQYIITSPDGVDYIVKEGLNQFCKNMQKDFGISLSPCGLSSAVTGRYKSHKGWTIKYLPQQDNELSSDTHHTQ